MVPPRPLLLLWLACATAGCETTDPCARREAACLDVVLVGKQDPVYYTGLTVKVAFPALTPALAPMTQALAELHATAPAAVQTVVTYQLPDDFNAAPDADPATVIAGLSSDTDRIARLKMMEKTDPRDIRVTVQGIEVNGAGRSQVCWDSRDDEAKFSSDQWLHQLYYRVGFDQYAAVYALLTPVADNASCPATP